MYLAIKMIKYFCVTLSHTHTYFLVMTFYQHHINYWHSCIQGEKIKIAIQNAHSSVVKDFISSFITVLSPVSTDEASEPDVWILSSVEGRI